jgi:hypothetical protein
MHSGKAKRDFGAARARLLTAFNSQSATRSTPRKADILLAMQNNPIEEWQRLTEVYAGMYDAELMNLAAEPGDLTETAKQVLGIEMRKRGLKDPNELDTAPSPFAPVPNNDWEQSVKHQSRDPIRDLELGDFPPIGVGLEQERDPEAEYTWKVPLCECSTSEEAWQLREVLRRAGIESWLEGAGGRYAFGAVNPKVMVAADQLDHARQIAANPIPQDVIDESKAPPEEFELPKCPKCGAEDPTLESADPTNSWLCEACGHQWTDASSDADQSAEK